MHKTLLKLATAGALITALLAVAMITQGCNNATDPKSQTNQSVQTTQTNEATQPSGNIIVDETGIHIQIPTEESVTTQPTEPAPTEKPGLGQIIVDFFENLFGGNKDETQPPEQETTTQATEDSGKVTYQDYLDMNDDQRADFQLSFAENRSESLDLFIEWLRVARTEYNENQVIGTIGPDGSINLEDFLNP